MKTRRFRPRLDGLETRIVPFTPLFQMAIGLHVAKGILDSKLNLALFSTENPGTPYGSVPIGGIGVDEEIKGLDANPGDGLLYTLVVDGTVGRVATIDPATGATSTVGSTFTVSGGEFGFDFNPVTGLAHIVSDADMHMTFNPATGTVTPLTNLAAAASVQGIAFSNSVPGATATTMYGIDDSTNGAVVIDPATGAVTPLNAAGFNVSPGVGFDIDPDGQAFGTFRFASGPDRLYGIPLTQNKAVFMGEFDPAFEVIDLAMFGTVTVQGGRTASFTDVDGDRVTVKLSKGIFGATELVLTPSAGGFSLQTLDLTDPSFAGTTVKITAKPGPDGGDGFVNVGAILAGGNNLGAVTVDGDLGRIVAGSPANTATQPGVKGLTVQSMGMLGGNLASTIAGALPSLTVKGDIKGAAINVAGNLGRAKVVGSLIGGAAADSGTIVADAIRSITVGGDIRAGTGARSGSVAADGSIGNMLVKGSLIGTEAAKVRVLAGSVITVKPAIGTLTVKGRVEHAQVLAGYAADGTAVNGDADIGRVVVGLDWIASDLVAGVSAVNGVFGDDDDLALAGASRIASIVIKGAASGTVGGTDHFGFVAREVVSLKVAGTKFALAKGPGNDLAGLAVGITGDLSVREAD